MSRIRANPSDLRRGSDASSLPGSDCGRPEENRRDIGCFDGLRMNRVIGSVDMDEALASGNSKDPFFMAPILGPLIVTNEASDARDHCANERTFLSYVKLSMYTTIVSVAIVLSFHLKSTPSDLELRIATPLGCIFWFLSVAVLMVGLANYIDTMNKYGKKTALVQTGWRTQLVIGMMSVSIMATCVVLLVIAKISDREEGVESGLLAMFEGGGTYEYKGEYAW